MRTLLIFIFVAVVSLIVYNPKLDDFKTYMVKLENESLLDQERTSFTNRMFNADTTKTDEIVAGFSTERNNYLIFSTYRIFRTTEFHEEELGRYLGIATMFFELGSSDGMTAHAAQP